MIGSLNLRKLARTRALSALLRPNLNGPSFENWDKALEIADGDPDLLVRLASYHYRQGHTAHLVRAVSRLHAIAPEAIDRLPTPIYRWPWLRRLRRSVRSFIDSWRRNHSTAQDLYDHARILEIIGRVEEAKQAYQRAQKIDPKTGSYVRLAAMEGGAIASLEDARTDLVRFHNRFRAEVQADSAHRIGGLNGHLAATRLAMFTSLLLPATIDVLLVEAMLADRLDRLGKVLARLPSSIKVPDESIESLAWIRTAASNDPAQEAERLYRMVLQLKPDHPRATFNLASLLARTGRATEATGLFERVAGLADGLAPHAKLQLAIIAGAAGDDQTSLGHYATAKLGIGELGHHHIALARTLRRTGRTQEALHHYKAAMSWDRYIAPEYVMNLESLEERAADFAWHGNPTLSALEGHKTS